jgi:hypothetical protein
MSRGYFFGDAFVAEAFAPFCFFVLAVFFGLLSPIALTPLVPPGVFTGC